MTNNTNEVENENELYLTYDKVFLLIEKILHASELCLNLD